MKYNVGDKVRIKSLDWYNENKDSNGNVVFSTKVTQFSWHENVRTVFTKDMSKFCGKVVTIETVWTVNYSIAEGTCIDYFTDEMIEGLVKEEIKNWADVSIPDDPFTVTYGSPSMNDSMNKNNIDNGIIILPEGYIFKDENGNEILTSKIILEKKKKEVTYPKTYEECCKVLEIEGNSLLINTKNITDYERDLGNLMGQLHRLIICRDAYWKIAGEEMGLGKPWKPDWESETELKYTIVVDANNVCKGQTVQINTILAFPTEEMRDAFYENFKELIEFCKELL